VAIPPAVGDAIDKMLAQGGNPETGPLFLTERGRPLYPAWSFRLLKKLPSRELLDGYYRHPEHVYRALKAGASWDRVTAATGRAEAHARRDYPRMG
jgi:hypothetical protein